MKTHYQPSCHLCMKLAFLFMIPLVINIPFSVMAQLNYQWAINMGGNYDDYGEDIAIDSSGNVLTIGNFYGTVDFDPGPGVFNLSSAGGSYDIFIQKLDALGNFIWAKRIGDNNEESGFSIAVDGAGNIYSTGYFAGVVDFDPGTGTFNLISSGGTRDVFIQKLDSYGNFHWAKKISSTGDDYGYSISLDTSANVYTTGFFRLTADFDPGPSTYNLTSAGMTDIFVEKLDSSGNFILAKNMGGPQDDVAYSAIVDASENIFITGQFGGTADFDPGAGTFNLTSGSGANIFMLKLDPSGNFTWATSMTGNGFSISFSIALDPAGNIYTTGYFHDTLDADPGAGIYNLISAGTLDIFFQKSDASGNFAWAKSIGGTGDEMGQSVASDNSGNLYYTGSYSGTVDFDPGPGIYNLTSAGSHDIFIQKLDTAGNFISAKSMGSSTYDEGLSINIDAFGNLYATGDFHGTVDFDPGVGTANLVSIGGTDVFVAKYSLITAVTDIARSTVLPLIQNPVQEQLHLFMPATYYGSVTLKIFDVSGQIVLIEKLRLPGEKSDSYQVNLQVGHLNKGIYFLEISSPALETITEKFLKL
jgi:type IX secretion system substrate protein/beta-propeller repeat-containing protein